MQKCALSETHKNQTLKAALQLSSVSICSLVTVNELKVTFLVLSALNLSGLLASCQYYPASLCSVLPGMIIFLFICLNDELDYTENHLQCV